MSKRALRTIFGILAAVALLAVVLSAVSAGVWAEPTHSGAPSMSPGDTPFCG